jgi:hypothetical protein
MWCRRYEAKAAARESIGQPINKRKRLAINWRSRLSKPEEYKTGSDQGQSSVQVAQQVVLDVVMPLKA